MNNNIKKSLFLVEAEQLDFLPKEFEARQSIQKKIMSELNKDGELIRTHHCVKNTNDAKLLEIFKQYEDNIVRSTRFMELPEIRRLIEELVHLEEATILSDFNQGLYYSTQPPYEKSKITSTTPKMLEKRK